MNESQYFNKARDMIQCGFDYGDFLAQYRPSLLGKYNANPYRIGKILASFMGQPEAISEIALYIEINFKRCEEVL